MTVNSRQHTKHPKALPNCAQAGLTYAQNNWAGFARQSVAGEGGGGEHGLASAISHDGLHQIAMCFGCQVPKCCRTAYSNIQHGASPWSRGDWLQGLNIWCGAQGNCLKWPFLVVTGTAAAKQQIFINKNWSPNITLRVVKKVPLRFGEVGGSCCWINFLGFGGVRMLCACDGCPQTDNALHVHSQLCA